MISRDDIVEAQRRMGTRTYRTPLIFSSTLSEQFECDLFFKAENLQRTGSFKIRGALNKVLSMTDEQKKRGVIAASSGNHALGVAYAAGIAGTHAVVVMPEDAREAKLGAVRALGAEVVLYGRTPGERYEEVHRLIEEHGYTLVHSCDEPLVIAGQGTVGLEIIEDLPDVDTIIVPLGAGALLGGVACAVKHHCRATNVIGVEPENVPRFTESRKAGRPVDVPDNASLADGLRMPRTFPALYELVETYVDEIVTASESEIREATVTMLDLAKMVVEPSAAIGLAALQSGTIQPANGKRYVVIATGGNISTQAVCGLAQG